MKVKRTPLACASALLALCCSFGVGAAENETQPVAIGSTTEAILKMQREGSAAGQAQPMSGEVASRAYKRYLESFTHPIPESGQTTGSSSRPATSGSR